MTILTAAGWAAIATFGFLWLLMVLVSLRPDGRPDIISTFGCQAVAYLLGLFGVLRLHAPRASIRDLLGVRAAHPAFYPLAALTGAALTPPISALYDLIERRWPSAGAGDEELVKLVTEGPLGARIAVSVVLVALGPAVEEVFFRGALTRPLLRRHGPATVIAVTAALFAVAHIEPQKFLPIAIFGLALGLVRYASGSLLPAIVMHATYNAIPLVAMTTGDGGGAEAADAAPIPRWILAASAALAAALVGSIWLVGARAEGAARARERDRA
ncbi:MAG: CPBP family intramembrane metalloprotease [Polyangiaceae bacterium]|nr:CPBP family intramembrane metalloprotease [Polyangiaceae bacterium]